MGETWAVSPGNLDIRGAYAIAPDDVMQSASIGVQKWHPIPLHC
jgi:hypothetical protein